MASYVTKQFSEVIKETEGNWGRSPYKQNFWKLFRILSEYFKI
jgi:hypothetical protein